MIRRFFYISLFLSLISGADVARAAVIIPGAADPGRIEKNRETLQTPEIRQKEVEYKIKKEEPVADDNLPKFVLKNLDIKGVTAYDKDELEEIYGKYIGQQITTQTLKEIAAALTAKYYEDGYILVIIRVPEQEIKDGAAEIDVVEGYVGNVRLTGDYEKSFLIDGVVERIKEQRPFSAKKLEREMLTLQSLNGLKATATIEPVPDGKAAPGEVGLAIAFAPGEIKDFISFDNQGSVFAGPLQWRATKNFHSVLQPYDRLSITGIASQPMREVKDGDISLQEIVTSDGLVLNLDYNRGRNEPGDNLKILEVKGRSESATIGVDYPLLLSRSETLNIGFQINHKDVESEALGTEIYHDIYTAVRIPLNYTKTDNWGGSNSVQFLYSQGVNLDDTTRTGSEDLSRKRGVSNFGKIEPQLSRLQQVGDDFQVLASVSGQYSWDALLSSEEFGYGGQEFGRAYSPSEITGDSGVSALGEVRYNGLEPFLNLNSQLFAFYDIGKVWNIDRGAENESSGSSAGGGVRLQSPQYGVTAEITAAMPLTRPIANPSQGNGKNPVILFNIRKFF